MKKIIYFAFIVVLIVACHPSSSYKISGTFNTEKFDGSTIFIKERVNRVWKSIDSVEVKDMKFQFLGKTDTAKICYLDITNSNDNHLRQSFILENGNIFVKFDSIGLATISGTKENEILSDFNLNIGIKEKKMGDFIQQSKAIYSSKWDEVKDSIQDIAAGLQTEINNIGIENATKYVNTLAGSQIFMSTFYYFTIKEKESLFAKMNEKTKSIPRIAELIKATEVEKNTSEGAHYINFTLSDTNGKLISLQNLIGKTDYLLIDFWASWCPDCRAALPELKEFYAKNHSKKFDILAISLDKDKDKWIESINKFELPWQNISDIKYWDCEAAKLYAVNAIPTTVLIDKSGTIIGRNLDLKKIQDLLNQIVTK